MTNRRVIAVDLGAETGRVVAVQYNGTTLTTEEIHRFPNVPVTVHGSLYWDVLRLWQDIETGLEMAGSDVGSIGVDTWGVDFALLDRDGRLLANPSHYRDNRTDGMMDWVFARVPQRTIFERTGIQFMQINTLYQLASMVRANSPLLDAAHTLLTIPDLFNYWLTGNRGCEFTHVTSSQCFNPRQQRWDFDTLTAVGIPADIFPAITYPGQRIGDYNGIPVITPACHDTGSAVVGVPTRTSNYAYLSSGTWSLLGLEMTEPTINDQAYTINVTNEGGAFGTYRLLKNVMGLWLAQQCRVAWRKHGAEYSYDDLTAQAINSEPYRSLIDPDNTMFLPPGDMPARIRMFCQLSGQPVPESVGQIVRTIYESLALKYRYVLDELLALTGREIEYLHIIGGGVQNTLLCQMTADATGRTVIAGPVEATAIGNGIAQLIGLGEIGDVAQAREILSQSVETVYYVPKHLEAWEEAYERFKVMVKRGASL